MKTQAELEGMETCETSENAESLDAEAMPSNDLLQHEEADGDSCAPNEAEVEC